MYKYFIIIVLILNQCTFIKANIVVLNGLSHQHHTEKGKVYRGTIEIQNLGKTNKSVKLYLQDLSYNADGAIQYSEPGTNKLTNTDWLKLNTNLVELLPGEKREIPYEITVPSHVSTPGSYWSTFILEPIAEISPTNEKNIGIQIQTIVRYAIQIITNYTTQSLSPELKFENITIENVGTQRILKVALSNPGKVYYLTKLSLEIFDSKEMNKIDGNFSSQTMSLLPNMSKSFPIDISVLQNGKYKAVAFAKDDQDNVFALEFELGIE